MLKISPFQQSQLNYLLAPLTVGVALVVSGAIPVTANPIIVQSQTCSSVIYGSPIPAPVPVNPVTGQPCSLSSNNYQNYNYRDYNYRDYDYGYDNYTRNQVRGTIRNSTLINPTIINSTISDSVLIDPTIVNSSRYNPRIIIRSNVIQRTPGITIHIGK